MTHFNDIVAAMALAGHKNRDYRNELNALITAFRQCQQREPNAEELAELSKAAAEVA